MASDIVLLGAPGAGKGTQARVLERRFGYAQLSTGDILRKNREAGTPLGHAAQNSMTRGELVPDELVLQMVDAELPSGRAVLFDGFPRNLAQARALDAMMEARGRGLPRAIYLDVTRSELEDRLLGRWTNPRTGRAYNERTNPPRVPGIDDEDGGPLIQRDDDKPETIGRRLDVFERDTLPLVAYYRDAPGGRFTRIDASRPVDDVTHELLDCIGVEHVR